MDISYPVTDYIRGSILTTKGDLVKHDGSSPARLPIGNIGYILRVNITGDDLEYIIPGTLLYQFTKSMTNNSVVTLDPVGTTILTKDFGELPSGNIYKIHGHVKVYNSGIATGLHLDLFKSSGTASFVFLHGAELLMYGGYIQQANSWYCNFSTILRIASSGTFVIELKGYGGNQCTVAIGDAQFFSNLQQHF